MLSNCFQNRILCPQLAVLIRSLWFNYGTIFLIQFQHRKVKVAPNKKSSEFLTRFLLTYEPHGKARVLELIKKLK